MSNVATNQAASKKNAPKTEHTNGAAAAAEDDGAWVEVGVDQPMYKFPEKAGGVLQGHLLDEIQMPDFQQKGDDGQMQTKSWSAFVIRLTRPAHCQAPNAQKGSSLVEYPAGTEVLVGLSAKMKDMRRFLLENKIVEVRLTNKGEIKLDNGRRMQAFDFQANKKTVLERGPLNRLTKHAAPQLAESNEEVIPF